MKYRVLEGVRIAVHYEQARGVPGLGRFLGDTFGGKVVSEISDLHWARPAAFRYRKKFPSGDNTMTSPSLNDFPYTSRLRVKA